MDTPRTHLALPAQLLIILTMLIGLACSIGHGQMLRPLFHPSEPAAQHLHHHAMQHDVMHPAAMHSGHDTLAQHHSHDAQMDHPPMPGMNSPFGDCFFAGSLPLILLLFTVLGWLLRHRPASPIVPQRICLLSPRAALPGLQPQAP